MRITLLAAALAAASAQFQSEELKELWGIWKHLHNKSYSPFEETRRFSIFLESYVKIVSHNKQNTGVKLALNQFSDMTREEFRAQYTSGLKVPQRHLRRQQNRTIDYSILGAPDAVDWRDKGAVTPVKNQKQCGSCWAFSATGALEGLNFLKNGNLLSFSEQQIVDCDDTSSGCGGGWMDHAFNYVAANGIEVEDDYPYTARDGTCKADASKAHKVNTALTDVAENDADALKAAIAGQPVSVAIEADEDVFRHYKSGVIKADCSADLNHGVLAVGYGTFDGEEAYIIKNSWDTTWGNKGYTLISTDGSANDGAGVCGILSAASYPTA